MSEMIEKKTNTPSSGVQEQQFAAASVEAPSYTQQRTIGQLLRGDLGFIPVLLTLVIIVVFFQVITNGLFLSPRNLSFLFIQTATIGLVGLGIVLVLLLGEIDLSVAAVSTFTSVIMGDVVARLGSPAWVAISAALLTGALVGCINGLFIAVLRIPSFIVTLAASIAYSGLLITLLFGQATLEIQDPFINAIAGSSVSFLPDYLGIGLPALAVILYVAYLVFNYQRRKRAGLRNPAFPQFLALIIVPAVVVAGAVIMFESYNGVPYSTALLFGLLTLFWIILTKTSLGRHIYAVGGNKEAARRAGINVVGIQIVVFTLCSVLAAVAGIVDTSRGNSVASLVSPTLLLDAIGAAVIGGVSLFGGKGSVWGLIIGILIIGSLDNGLALKNLGSDVRQLVEGIVLLIAVTSDAVLRRVQARSASGR